eukprot:gene3255-4075_t
MGKQPHRALFEMSKKYGHFFRIWMGDDYALVISDPILVREVWVKNLESFISIPKTPSVAIISNNFKGLVSATEVERWKALRSITSSAFSMLKIKTLATTIIEKQTMNLISKMKQFSDSKQGYDPSRYNKKYSMNIILNYVFSEPEIPWNESVYEGKIHRLSDPIDRLFRDFAIGQMGDYLHLLNKPFYIYQKLKGPPIDIITKFIRDIYEEHKKSIDFENPRDLLDSIIIALNEKDIDPETAIFIGNDMILAGTDTSSTTISWFLLLMANYPNIQEKVYAEIKDVFKKENGENVVITCKDTSRAPYLNATIKEVMRYKPITPLGLSKVAIEDCHIGDYFVPAGTQVIQNTFGLCKSTDYWIDPNEFNPARFLNDHHNDHFLPFSVGPRHCIGLNLAKEEIFSACSNIILNFKISRISDQLIDEYENFGTTISPNHFEINLEPRT